MSAVRSVFHFRELLYKKSARMEMELLILQRDFVLLRDFTYYYETLRFTLMGEPFS